MKAIQMFEFIKNWVSPTTKTIGFEDVITSIKHNYVIINTLSVIEQTCLIYGTIPIEREESIMNEMIHKNDMNSRILLYGKNASDGSVYDKYKQLTNFGFRQVYIYTGGLFEWLLLQDIYGTSEFPTTTKCKDMLVYKPPAIFSQIRQITYNK